MKSEECICFDCPNIEMIKKGQDYDCACESGPTYDKEACSDCKHANYCDVALNPELYSPEKIFECPSCGFRSCSGPCFFCDMGMAD